MNYNQKYIISTTTSPYFTKEVIDNACYNCANEIGTPIGWTSQCDICKTLTVKEVTTYSYFDFFYLVFKIILGFVIIWTVATKLRRRK